MKSNQSLLQPLAAWAVIAVMTPWAGAQSIWNATNGVAVNTNWSTAGNWSPSGVPGSSTAVRFVDNAAQTVPGTINSVVDSTTTISNLQLNQTNGTHTILIPSGVTLNITGTGGLTNSCPTNATIVGSSALRTNSITGAGTLVLNNASAFIVVRQAPGDGNGTGNRTTLNMQGLDNFNATASRVMIGNANIATPFNRATGRLFLARTNTITASGTSPALIVGESDSNNGSGSTLFLGQTNVLLINNIGIGRTKETGTSMRFNTTAFASSTAYIRSATGTRLGSWAIGDGQSDSGTTSCNGTCDFTGGTLDAQVDTLQVGRGGSAGTGGAQSSGTLTLVAGTLDVNTLQMGFQGGSTGGKGGNGTVNINGGTLLVNTTLEMGRTVGGLGYTQDVARLNINGGTVLAAKIDANFANATNNNITMNSGTLTVTNTAGPGIASLTMTNSTLTLAAAATPNMVVTNLTTGGAADTVNVSSLPPITTYPAQFPLIKYSGAVGGVGFSIMGLGSLPTVTPAFQGYLSNNTAATTIDVVITNGPIPPQAITWNGNVSGDWDGSTLNWLAGASPTNYNVAGDYVTFDDSLTGTNTVTLTATLVPASLAVNNTLSNYTFVGSGKISGATGLTKQGTGTLSIENTAANDFSGAITLTAGTLKYNQSVDATVANVISGAGALVKDNTGTLTLSGGNSYTGTTTINGGTAKVAHITNSFGAIPGGAVTVNSGGTIDVGGLGTANNIGFTNASGQAKQFYIAGTGVGGNGAIINSGTVNQQQAFQLITLTGDATVGGATRWDMRGNGGITPILDLGGYTLTKTGPNQVTLVSAIATNGNLVINQGLLSVETSSLVPGPGTITVNSGASLGHFRLSGGVSKDIILNGGTITNLSTTAGNSSNYSAITLTANSFIGNAGARDASQLLFNGPISESGGSYGLTVLSTGFMDLRGANTFTGKIIVGAGGAATLCILDDSNLGTPPGSFVADQIILTNGGVLRITNNFTLHANRGIYLGGGIGQLAQASDFNEVGKWTLTYNGVISGPGDFQKGANGNLVLGGANTYGGRTIMSDGGSHTAEFRLGANEVVPDTSPVSLVCTFNLNGFSETIGSLTNNGNGAVFLGSGTLTTGGDNTSGSLSAKFGGSGNIVKVGTGTWTLTGASTNTGNLTVNGGTLAFGSGGSMSSAAVLVVGSTPANSSAVLDASATGLTLGASQTLKGHGTVVGTVSVGGTVSPGSSVGTLTNTGALLLQGGGTNVMEVVDTAGLPGAGYDTIRVSSDIGVLSTSGSKFTIKLASLDGAGAAGNVTNFNYDTSYIWTNATGNLTNFVADKLRVDYSSFSNDVAGGDFVVEPGSLNVRFTNNHAPSTVLATYSRGPGVSLKINIADLLSASTSDPDGDARAFVSADATSTNSASVTSDASFIYYANTNNVTDRFNFTVRDVRNYRAGIDTVRTAGGTIEVQISASSGTNAVLSVTPSGSGTNVINFAGIPGFQYVVQFSTNLSDWEDLSTNLAGSNGLWSVIDDTATNDMRFYRSAAR